MTWGIVVVALAALVLLGSVVAFATRRRWLRWYRLRRWPYRTRHPIVLVHGLMGFDEVRVGPRRHEYFKGIELRLRERGNEVYRPRLPAVASVAKRAEALKQFVDTLGDRSVILIAHSMGGLDARYAVTRLGLAPRVKALITIATPHRGTPLADAGTSIASKIGLRAVVKALGVDVDAFDDLTQARMKRFNDEVGDVRGVLYASVIGRGDTVHPLLRPTHAYLRRCEGANDGLVPVESQAWGEVLFESQADHWGLIGWSAPDDAAALYESIALELRARGF